MAEKKDKEMGLNEGEVAKREIIENYFTIKKLHGRLERIEDDNKDYVTKYKNLKDELEKEKKDKDEFMEKYKKDKDKLKKEKTQMEYELDQEKKTIIRLKEDHVKSIERKEAEFEIERNDFKEKLTGLTAQLEAKDDFLKNKAHLEGQLKKLKEDLDFERKEKLREIADKDREKVQATDKLKKDMLRKIKETKMNSRALQDEQLHTTTRLTVLQNHQLTTELEYQSKQTEKLLFKNSKLQEQVTTLKRDVEIHKQVEQELAKRSHFCQRLIKKLSQKIKELEEENEGLKRGEQNASVNNKSKKDSFQDDKTKDELIGFLEKNLETSEKRLAKMQNDYDILKNENQYLQKKMETKSNKYANLATLIADNLESLKEKQQIDPNELENSDQKIHQLDLTEIANKDLSDLRTEEKEILLNILLQQIKPLINKKTLNLPETKNMNVILLDEKSVIQGQGENLSLPRIPSQDINRQDDPNKGASRFKDVPVDISTKIIRSNIKDWGKAGAPPTGAVVNGGGGTAGAGSQKKFKL